VLRRVARDGPRASGSAGVLTVGLTGGIGSGKSEVSARLAELGAIVVDADDIARAVVEPGTDGFAAVVAAFGRAVVNHDGGLDRGRLAQIVFADPRARVRLEEIVHPRVQATTKSLLQAAPEGSIFVNAVPLLVETGRAAEYDLVVVVEAPLELRMQRLAEGRGMTPEEALARIEAQADDAARRAVAWRVIVNDSTLDLLRAQVDELWGALSEERGAGAIT
jgi:dephospho-CoA kinase